MMREPSVKHTTSSFRRDVYFVIMIEVILWKNFITSHSHSLTQLNVWQMHSTVHTSDSCCSYDRHIPDLSCVSHIIHHTHAGHSTSFSMSSLSLPGLGQHGYWLHIIASWKSVHKFRLWWIMYFC